MVKNCIYCSDVTKGILELGRGKYIMKIPCCKNCLNEIQKLPQYRKDQMSEFAFVNQKNKR